MATGNSNWDAPSNYSLRKCCIPVASLFALQRKFSIFVARNVEGNLRDIRGLPFYVYSLTN